VIAAAAELLLGLSASRRPLPVVAPAGRPPAGPARGRAPPA
jgi:hypothetical protein